MAVRLLSDDLINKIAAGEVVERPASVVKELVENAIDAGSTEVIVDLSEGGRASIRVTDNGHGMGRDDALMAIERHATSKIRTAADLEMIQSLGFRGEALPSIASVSRFSLTTADGAGPAGTRIEIDGGRVRKVSDAASPRGTQVEVTDLFFNVPARRKFLKAAGTELAHIAHAIDRIALCNPAIHVRLTHGGRKSADYPAVKSLKERAFQVLGAETAKDLISVEGGEPGLLVSGLVSKPGTSRGDKKHQEMFVNGRWVRNNALGHALYEAYHSLLMRDRHPVALLFVQIDPSAVDVNVHPAKSEVRFSEARRVHDVVRRTVVEGLLGPVGGAQGDNFRPATTEKFAASPPLPAPSVREMSTPYEVGDQRWEPTLRGISDAGKGLVPEGEAVSPCFQVHCSFIIAETPEGFDIVDQHAAHERILYDRYRKKLREGAVVVQGLLFPVQVSLPQGEVEVLHAHLDTLERMGVDVDLFGEGTLLVRGLPAFLSSLDQGAVGDLLSGIAGEFFAQERSGRLGDMEERLALVMICHSSVRAKQRLDVREMQALLGRLRTTEMPSTCPHGRPISLSFTLGELERMFKRSL